MAELPWTEQRTPSTMISLFPDGRLASQTSQRKDLQFTTGQMTPLTPREDLTEKCRLSVSPRSLSLNASSTRYTQHAAFRRSICELPSGLNKKRWLRQDHTDCAYTYFFKHTAAMITYTSHRMHTNIKSIQLSHIHRTFSLQKKQTKDAMTK